jgi:uncharacterized protein (TIGR02246 family)
MPKSEPTTQSITELEQLAARVYIRELLDRYHAGVNARDFELLASLFADDAIWEVGPPANLRVAGRDSIVAMLRQTVGRQELLVQANFAVVIDLHDRDHATAHSTIVELGREPSGKGMQVIGRYDDELVRDRGTWKYARHAMTVTFDNDAAVAGALRGKPSSR